MIDPTVFFVPATILLGDQLLQPLLDGCLREVEVAEVGVIPHAFVELQECDSIATRRMGVF